MTITFWLLIFVIGTHTFGSYETCCNASALSPAISWFMNNRGNLSVLLHPLTRYEVIDHTTRAMWLGPSIPLDLGALKADLGSETAVDHCQLTDNGAGQKTTAKKTIVSPQLPTTRRTTKPPNLAGPLDQFADI